MEEIVKIKIHDDFTNSEVEHSLIFEKELRGGLILLKTITDKNNLDECYDKLSYFVCSENKLINVYDFPFVLNESYDYGYSYKNEIIGSSNNFKEIFEEMKQRKFEEFQREFDAGDSVYLTEQAKEKSHICSEAICMDIDLDGEFTISDALTKYKKHDTSQEFPYTEYILVNDDEDYLSADISKNDIVSSILVKFKQGQKLNSPQQIVDQEVAKIDAEAEKKASQSTRPKLG